MDNVHIRVWAIVGGLLLDGVIAEAKVRSIPFVGLAAAAFQTGDIANANATASCVVTISNVGKTDQRIVSAGFLDYQAQSSKTGAALLSPTQQSFRSSSASSSTCIGTTLIPGATCVLRFITNTISIEQRQMLCTGKLVVEDVTAASADGALIASGAIAIVQESIVAGGVLSGAFYQSPPKVSTNDGTIYWGNAPSPTAILNKGNMNIFCSTACAINEGVNNDPPMTQAQCDEHCGAGNAEATGGAGAVRDLYQTPGGHPAMNVGAHIQNNHLYNHGQDDHWVSNLAYRGCYSGATPSDSGLIAGSSCGKFGTWTYQYRPLAPYLWDDYYGSGAFVRTLIWPSESPAEVFTSYVSPTPIPQLTPTMMVERANAYYAGGMVYEMIAGPLTSICSGNVTYWGEGGGEFSHADGIDGHAIIKGSNSSYPPERLACAHRHAKDDLFLRLGSTSSFVINGGDPF